METFRKTVSIPLRRRDRPHGEKMKRAKGPGRAEQQPPPREGGRGEHGRQDAGNRLSVPSSAGSKPLLRGAEGPQGRVAGEWTTVTEREGVGAVPQDSASGCCVRNADN